MAGRWLCTGGTQLVRVVHGDGQILSLACPVTVAEILEGHPHQYICHMSPDLPANKSAMLPLDYELEPGYVYFLLPLPRLFPTSVPGPPSCCCHVTSHDEGGEEGLIHPSYLSDYPKAGGFSPLRKKSLVQMFERIGSPLGSAKKKVSPEVSRSPASTMNSVGSGKQDQTLLSPSYGSSNEKKQIFRRLTRKNSPSRNFPSRNVNERPKTDKNNVQCTTFESIYAKWKPGLGCIMESDAFLPASEEQRLCLDRRRLTFDGKVRSSSPIRLADVCRSLST